MLITAAAGPDAALVTPEPLARNRDARISVTNGGVTLAITGALLLVANGVFALVPNLRRARARRAARQAPA